MCDRFIEVSNKDETLFIDYPEHILCVVQSLSRIMSGSDLLNMEDVNKIHEINRLIDEVQGE